MDSAPIVVSIGTTSVCTAGTGASAQLKLEVLVQLPAQAVYII